MHCILNFYSGLSWNSLKNRRYDKEFDIKKYYEILCPPQEYPDFLDKYIALPSLQRLNGISLFCGTDWTNLYNNHIKYSRLDHSIGVALIIWHFTKDKIQTLAGLLHDISTPVFSHVTDFRKGDALTQTATESLTALFIQKDEKLQNYLYKDGINPKDVEDYHNYPICDNEIPGLSADRLEYSFPSGIALDASWDLKTIKKCYDNITIFTSQNNQNKEDNCIELGFSDIPEAELYCYNFCSMGHILLLNENKLTLQMLGQIMNMAVELKILNEEEFFTLSEAQVINEIEKWILNNRVLIYNEDNAHRFAVYYYTFRNMTEILHTNEKQPDDLYFNVSLNVKKRYINPLVKNNGKIYRLSEISSTAANYIQSFNDFSDTLYGSVKLIINLDDYLNKTLK